MWGTPVLGRSRRSNSEGSKSTHQNGRNSLFAHPCFEYINAGCHLLKRQNIKMHMHTLLLGHIHPYVLSKNAHLAFPDPFLLNKQSHTEVLTLSDTFHYWSKRVWRCGTRILQSNVTQEEQALDGSSYEKQEEEETKLLPDGTRQGLQIHLFIWCSLCHTTAVIHASTLNEIWYTHPRLNPLKLEH